MNPNEFTLERGGRVYRLIRRPGRPGWYLRLPKPGGRGRTWIKCGDDDHFDIALAYAADALRKARAGAHPYSQFRAETAWRSAVTVQALADRWMTAGYPSDNRARSDAERLRQAERLGTALRWWGDKALAQIDARMMKTYARVRRQNSAHARYTCERIVDVELAVLSNLCSWAVSERLIDSNPFDRRPTFRAASSVRHCHTVCCASDEELHVLLGQIAVENPVFAAYCACQALTGLRPGEPSALRWPITWAGGRPQPGTLYERVQDGQAHQFVAVWRQKRGQNPAVRVHPALASFISAWRAYHAAHWPDSPWWFPDPEAPDRTYLDAQARGTLNRRLIRACGALGLPLRTPHSFRAYYVRVRRSQGALDGAIASEIGDASAELIRHTYGDPEGIAGDNQFDWLPAPPVQPIWSILRPDLIPCITLESNLESSKVDSNSPKVTQSGQAPSNMHSPQPLGEQAHTAQQQHVNHVSA